MANIFTIKVGSPNLLNSPLLDGELGFHLTNNTLYIGSSSGAVPIGGAGAFVPFNEDKTISIKGLTLTDPLQPEYGGTGTTDLSTLTFVTSQITDLDLSKYLTKVNWNEVGFTENDGKWSLNVNNLTINSLPVATEAFVNNAIDKIPSVDLQNYYTKTEVNNNFLKLDGTTKMTGNLTFSNSNQNYSIYFKNSTGDPSGYLTSSNYSISLRTDGNWYTGITLNGNRNSVSINDAIKLNDGKSGNSYSIYHSGWEGNLSLYARSTSSSNYRSIQILGPDNSGISDRNALRYQTYWGSSSTFTIYHSFNIVYSESQPTQDVFNGMIWLKPA